MEQWWDCILNQSCAWFHIPERTNKMDIEVVVEACGFDSSSAACWRMGWQPSPVFWPGEPHGQRSLVSYSPRGRQESDTPERRTHTHCRLLTVWPWPGYFPSKTQAATESDDTALLEIKGADAGEPNRVCTLREPSATILGTVDATHAHTVWESGL